MRATGWGGLRTRIVLLISVLVVAATAGAVARFALTASATSPVVAMRMQERRLPTTFYGSNVTAAELGPTGKVAMGTARGDVVVLDLEDGDRVILDYLVEDKGQVSAMAFSRDGHTFAAATNTGVVEVWRQQRQGIYRSWWTFSGQVQFEAIALSADGRLLAVATSSGPVFVYDTATQKNIVRVEAEMSGEAWAVGVQSLAFSTSGTELLAGLNDGIRAWDLATGTAREVGEPCGSVHVTVGAEMASCASMTGHVSVVDLRSGKTIAEQTISRTKSAADTVTTADGALVFGLTGAGEIVAWEPATDRILSRLTISTTDHEDYWGALDIAADGRTLLVVEAHPTTPSIVTVDGWPA